MNMKEPTMINNTKALREALASGVRVEVKLNRGHTWWKTQLEANASEGALRLALARGEYRIAEN